MHPVMLRQQLVYTDLGPHTNSLGKLSIYHEFKAMSFWISKTWTKIYITSAN